MGLQMDIAKKQIVKDKILVTALELNSAFDIINKFNRNVKGRCRWRWTGYDKIFTAKYKINGNHEQSEGNNFWNNAGSSQRLWSQWSTEIIIFQLSDMLSDFARIYVGHFSFNSVNKFFYNIIKTSPKFSHFVARSCVDCTRGGRDGAITLTQ